MSWDEAKHRRAGKGRENGGQFISMQDTVDDLDKDPNRLFLLTDEQLRKNYAQAEKSPLYNPAVEKFRASIADLMPEDVADEYEKLRERGSQLAASATAIQKRVDSVGTYDAVLGQYELNSVGSLDLIANRLKKHLASGHESKQELVDFMKSRFETDLKRSRWSDSNKVSEEEQRSIIDNVIESIAGTYDAIDKHRKAVTTYAQHTTGLRDAQRDAIEKANAILDEQINGGEAHENTVAYSNLSDNYDLDINTVVDQGFRLARRLKVPEPDMALYNKIPASYSPSSAHITLGVNDSIDMSAAFAHEYGHHIEHSLPNVQKAAMAFVKRRTAGEKAEQHGAWSVTRDAFLIPYTGFLRHDNPSTEAISVGMEMLVRDPVSFARHDPEHFYLMAHTLWGM